MLHVCYASEVVESAVFKTDLYSSLEIQMRKREGTDEGRGMSNSEKSLIFSLLTSVLSPQSRC